MKKLYIILLVLVFNLSILVPTFAGGTYSGFLGGEVRYEWLVVYRDGTNHEKKVKCSAYGDSNIGIFVYFDDKDTNSFGGHDMFIPLHRVIEIKKINNNK